MAIHAEFSPPTIIIGPVELSRPTIEQYMNVELNPSTIDRVDLPRLSKITLLAELNRPILGHAESSRPTIIGHVELIQRNNT